MVTDENGNRIRTAQRTDADGNLTNEEIETADQNGKLLSTVSKTTNPATGFTAEVDMNGVQGVEVKNLDLNLAIEVLTSDELTAYGGGAQVTLRMETSDATATVTESEKTLVKNTLQAKGVSQTGAKYYDITLYKKVGTGAEVKVTDTGSKTVGIVMDIPADMKNTNADIKRTFFIVELHNGVGKIVMQGTGDQISFEGNEFSIYTLAYNDQTISSGSSSGSGSSSSSSSSSSGSTLTSTAATLVIAPKTGEDTNAGMTLILLGAAFATAAAVCRRKQMLEK